VTLAFMQISIVPRLLGIDVVGARHVSVAQAKSTSGLIDQPLFHASAAEARAALLRLPALRDARVSIDLSTAAAQVTLVEREAAGRWVVGATEWFVDADGVLFASVDPTAAPALRVRDLRVPQRRAGERVDAALVAAALHLAKIAPGELRADATAPAVRIEPGPDGIVVASGAGWEIRFGAADRVEEKLALAQRFLREQPSRRLEYVDVRSAERIVFSPTQ
jgi:hypothetical protein